MCTFFTSIGLPRLVVVDADNLFSGVFKQLFTLLQIPIHQISRENHKAIRNERFHRYLNKVQRINTADVASMFRWKQGALFALYAWNASPIDGTDISRSIVAIGREFPFPIDIEPTINHEALTEGQPALDHLDSAGPLLYRQRDLLAILNAERRQRHIDLRNDGKLSPSFSPGDVVIVRKQVQSRTAEGISAKLLFRTKGPYRVLEQISPSSYSVQKLPFLRGIGIPGKVQKENAARMTKLPSTLILHKRANGADTRFSQLSGNFAQMPLQKWLKTTVPGAYCQADQQKMWAFEPLDSMWTEEISDDGSVSGSESDGDVVADGDTPDEPPLRPIILAEQLVTTPNWPTRKNPTNALTSRKALSLLYNTICDSTDRLFFIAGDPIQNASNRDNSVKPFSLAQVDLRATNPIQARTAGVYKMRLWMQQKQDASTRSMTQSRFYPAAQTLQTNTCLNAPQPVRPEKIEQLLKLDPTTQWPHFDVPLADVCIVGPFDFTQKRLGLRGPKKLAISETHHIDDIYWQQLEAKGPLFDIDTQSIWQSPAAV
jgi:hypothetical protein